MRRLTLDNLKTEAASLRRPYHDDYFAMYSSVCDAVTTDPVLMTVPVDDHMVHRGDAVFETFKCVDGGLYNLGAHLDRLEASAARIALALPVDRATLRAIVLETVRAADRPCAAVRLLISRGPGSLGVNPYDCPRPQCYVVVARLPEPFMRRHPEGARVKRSALAAKDAFFAQTKNCNYLLNALMKKEAVDAGMDFVVTFDERGFLAEGATENVALVTADRRLLFPRLSGTLEGTTMTRVMALCGADRGGGVPADVAFADLSVADVAAAAEFLLFGTTIDVVAAREFDGRAVGDGRPGPVYAALAARLSADIASNPTMRTPVHAVR